MPDLEKTHRATVGTIVSGDISAHNVEVQIQLSRMRKKDCDHCRNDVANILDKVESYVLDSLRNEEESNMREREHHVGQENWSKVMAKKQKLKEQHKETLKRCLELQTKITVLDEEKKRSQESYEIIRERENHKDGQIQGLTSELKSSTEKCNQLQQYINEVKHHDNDKVIASENASVSSLMESDSLFTLEPYEGFFQEVAISEVYDPAINQRAASCTGDQNKLGAENSEPADLLLRGKSTHLKTSSVPGGLDHLDDPQFGTNVLLLHGDGTSQDMGNARPESSIETLLPIDKNSNDIDILNVPILEDEATNIENLIPQSALLETLGDLCPLSVESPAELNVDVVTDVLNPCHDILSSPTDNPNTVSSKALHRTDDETCLSQAKISELSMSRNEWESSLTDKFVFPHCSSSKFCPERNSGKTTNDGGSVSAICVTPAKNISKKRHRSVNNVGPDPVDTPPLKKLRRPQEATRDVSCDGKLNLNTPDLPKAKRRRKQPEDALIRLSTDQQIRLIQSLISVLTDTKINAKRPKEKILYEKAATLYGNDFPIPVENIRHTVNNFLKRQLNKLDSKKKIADVKRNVDEFIDTLQKVLNSLENGVDVRNVQD